MILAYFPDRARLDIFGSALTTLLDLALQESHKQARIAASVLLSANRSLIRPSQEWLVSVPDIGLLNEREHNAALAVIHGRITQKRYPETVLQGGTALFSKLWHRWRNIEQW
jgi:hypothetical protein